MHELKLHIQNWVIAYISHTCQLALKTMPIWSESSFEPEILVEWKHVETRNILFSKLSGSKKRLFKLGAKLIQFYARLASVISLLIKHYYELFKKTNSIKNRLHCLHYFFSFPMLLEIA